MNDVPEEFDSPDETGQPGPWIIAGFDGICSRGGERTFEGEDIRADGNGGWECKDCVDDDQEYVPLFEYLHDEPTSGYHGYRGFMEGDSE